MACSPQLIAAGGNRREIARTSDALPESSERAKREMEIQLAVGIPLIAVQGYASVDTREAFSRARTLCLQLGNMPEYSKPYMDYGGIPG